MKDLNEDEKRATRVFIMNAKKSNSDAFFDGVTYVLYAVFALAILAGVGAFGWYMEKLKFDYIYKDSVEEIIKNEAVK